MRIDLPALFWALATLACYLLARELQRRLPRWWTSPLLVTWGVCFTLALALKATYGDYLRGTGWLVTLLGPATMAFAMPIFEQRRLIRRHWPILAVGVTAGTCLAFGSTWIFAGLLGLEGPFRISLLPRSVSTPFAVDFAGKVGGLPELTATCAVCTGLLGASIGEWVLTWLPLRSAMARGAMLGMGAHGMGTAKARQLGEVEGSVAGLTMVLAGLASAVAAPFIALWLH